MRWKFDFQLKPNTKHNFILQVFKHKSSLKVVVAVLFVFVCNMGNNSSCPPSFSYVIFLLYLICRVDRRVCSTFCREFILCMCVCEYERVCRNILGILLCNLMDLNVLTCKTVARSIDMFRVLHKLKPQRSSARPRICTRTHMY